MPMSPEARKRLSDTIRALRTELLDSAKGGLEVDEGETTEIRWWTFAGGRINATLRHALAAVGGDWKIVTDNFLIRIRGEDLDRHRFEAAQTRIAAPDFWEGARRWMQT